MTNVTVWTTKARQYPKIYMLKTRCITTCSCELQELLHPAQFKQSHTLPFHVKTETFNPTQQQDCPPRDTEASDDAHTYLGVHGSNHEPPFAPHLPYIHSLRHAFKQLSQFGKDSKVGMSDVLGPQAFDAGEAFREEQNILRQMRLC
jgi:hypothetical protein